MVIEKCLVICSLLFLVSAVVGSSLHRKDDISDDYYFGRKGLDLRTTREQFEWKKESKYSPVLILQQNNDDEDDSSSDVSDEAQPEPVYVKHQALRHHIAHFCPNLDEARVCIRKCSKEGKPAFCGKDHVCYCGHTYSAHDKNDKINVADVYGQFHDLYKKYFGDNSDHVSPKSPNDHSEVQEIARVI